MGTISDKTTYLNTTKTKIREKINDLGQDLDEEETFRSYAEALEQVWNEYPKVSVTDVEEASLNGTKKGRMKIDLKGQTEQEQLSGKNLYNNNAEITRYYYNDSGQLVEGSNGDTFINTVIENNIDTHYTISYKERIGTTPYVRFAFFDGDTFIRRILLTNNNSFLDVPANTTKIDIRTDKRETKYFEDLQIEAGSTATDFELYCRTEYQAQIHNFHNKLKM